MRDPNIDDLMKVYAVDAVAAAARRGVTLDYSEESLNRVDELLGRESFIGRTPRGPESPEDEERLWTLSKMLGAYVGEVALRQVGGHWFGEPTDDGGIRPAIAVQGAKGFPVDMVWKRLTESEFKSVGGYCRVLRVILERQATDRHVPDSDEAE
jgi:hypothetical protein